MGRIGADETQEKSAQMIAAHQSTENRLMSLRDALTATPSSTSLRVVVEALVQAWLTRMAAAPSLIEELLAAVMVPSFLKAGLRPGILSSLTLPGVSSLI